MAKKNRPETATPIRSTRREVSMEKVNNGYIVSRWSNDNHVRFIEPNKKAAKQRATRLLG